MSAIQKSDTLQAVETILSYHFNNPELLWEALQAAGAIYPGEGLRVNGNKRLALVGDEVLGLVLKEDWYHSGALSERAAQIIEQVAGNANLDWVGKLLGLDRYVNRRGTGAVGMVPWRTMSATMEAILGAVYLDDGVGSVRLVMTTLGLAPT